MRSLKLTVVFAAGVLLSCSSAPKTDPLEAKAKAGDPVAVCQLIARDLHACAEERSAWEKAPSSPSPACFGEMINDRHESYLKSAEAGIKSRHQSTLPLMLHEISLRTAAILVIVGPTEKALADTAKLEQECTELSKFAQ